MASDEVIYDTEILNVVELEM